MCAAAVRSAGRRCERGSGRVFAPVEGGGPLEEPGRGDSGGAFGPEPGGPEKRPRRRCGRSFPPTCTGPGRSRWPRPPCRNWNGTTDSLICSDAAAGTLLEARLETIAGAERVFDFGALSYAHPKTGAKIEQQAAAHLPADTADPVRRALAKAQAARRVVGCDLAAGCAEREGDCVLVLSCKKGCWLRTVPLADRPALWLLDMIRRAACDLPQAAGTGFLPARKAARTAQPEAAPPARRPRRARRVLVVLLVLAVLAALCTVGAWVYTGGNFYALPQRLRSLWADGLPHSGAVLL